MKLLSWLRGWRAEGDDSASRVTGIRQTHAAPYDETKAVQWYLKSRRQTASGRVYQARKDSDDAL